MGGAAAAAGGKGCDRPGEVSTRDEFSQSYGSQASGGHRDEATLPGSGLLEPRARGERPTAGLLLGSLLATLVGATSAPALKRADPRAPGAPIDRNHAARYYAS